VVNESVAQTAAEPLTRTAKLTLTAAALAVLLVALDLTSLNVVITQVQQDFSIGITTAQWVIAAYLLVFASLVVVGGRFADMFGRRRLVLIGCVIFAGASLSGGLAQTDSWLIASRAVQGIGGAMLWPAALGMAVTAVPKGRQALAMALVVSAAALGTALGPLVGGVLGELFDWRLVLLFNLPVAALVITVVARVVTEQPVDTQERGVDYLGVAISAVALGAILFAITQATSWGWDDGRTIGLLAIGLLLLLLLFLVIEKRSTHPLFPRDVIGKRSFALVALIGPTLLGPFLIALLYLPQFFEKFKGWSILEAALSVLPMTVGFAIIAPFSSRVYERLGAKLILVLACAFVVIGSLIIAVADEAVSYIVILPGLVLFGAGLGLGISSVNTTAVGAAPENRKSVASGIVYMMRLMLGTVLLTIATSLYVSIGDDRLVDKLNAEQIELSAKSISQLEGSLTGNATAQKALDTLPAKQAKVVEPAVADAFLGGLHVAMFFSAGIATVGALIALFFVSGRLRPSNHLRESRDLSGSPIWGSLRDHGKT